MARPRKTGLYGTKLESKQRKFFEHHELEQYHHSNQQSDQRQTIRRFQINKSTPLGLIFPQNLQYQLNEFDDERLRSNVSNVAPIFTSNDMQWWKVKYFLPPTMTLYAPEDERSGSPKSTSRGPIGGPLPTSLSEEDEEDKYDKSQHPPQNPTNSYPFAVIKYPGWQGVTQLTVNLTIYNMKESMHYDTSSASNVTGDLRSRWTIKRVGWARRYNVIPVSGSSSASCLQWRSSKTILDIPDIQDGYPKANGNLKLEDADAKLIAVYKQRRDWDVMGNLTVFTDELRGGVTIELVVASCLAVVTYERLGFQNGFGH